MQEVVKENTDRKNEKIIEIYNQKIIEEGFLRIKNRYNKR